MRIVLALFIGFSVFWLGKALTWTIITPSLVETMNAYAAAHRAGEPGRLFATVGDDIHLLSMAISLSVGVFWSLAGGIVAGAISPIDALRSALFMSVLAVLEFAAVQWWMISTMRAIDGNRIGDLLMTEAPWLLVTLLCIFLGALAGRKLRAS